MGLFRSRPFDTALSLSTLQRFRGLCCGRVLNVGWMDGQGLLLEGAGNGLCAEKVCQ